MYWTEIDRVFTQKKCNHKAEYRLDGLISCRVCGELLPEVILGGYDDYGAAVRAMSGVIRREGFMLDHFDKSLSDPNGLYPVYIKGNFELTINKRGIKYEVLKRSKQNDTGV